MKLASTLLTLLCGITLAADYDAAKQTVSNDFFVVKLDNTDTWGSTVDIDGVVAATMASIDYYQDLLSPNHSLSIFNRINFSIDFDTLGTGVLGVASSNLIIGGGDADGLSAESYKPYTNSSNGLTYNTLYTSEARLLHNKPLLGTTDFTIDFNRTQDFYYGSGLDTGEKTDFHSVLLHEITHGMGFGSYLFKGTAAGELTLSTRTRSVQTGTDEHGDPVYSEVNVIDKDGNPVYNLTSFDTMILQNLTNNDPTELTLGMNVALGDPANGINIYNPSTYAPGSSISHISKESDPDALMNFALADGVIKRELSLSELNMLHAMGYTGIPEPSSAALILILIPAAAMRRRRRADAA